jgi:hypothetical protein
MHWYVVSLSDDGEDPEKLGIEVLKKLRLTIDPEVKVYLTDKDLSEYQEIEVKVDKG